MKIDRKNLIKRHCPKVSKVEPLSPLSVGNGEFAFTADITGLQTFPDSYEVPLGTQSNWGWHSTNQPNQYTLADIDFQSLETYGRKVDYPIYPGTKPEAYHWLRQNPHRLQLGQLSLLLYKENGELAHLGDLEAINQILNLWEGSLDSEFKVQGESVFVKTVCDPDADRLGVSIQSSLLRKGRLQVMVKFPDPDVCSDEWEEATQLKWENSGRHSTTILSQSNHSVRFKRQLDLDGYEVAWEWSEGVLKEISEHEYILESGDIAELTFSISFATNSPSVSEFEDIVYQSKEHWEAFWLNGAAIDFSDSHDPRAHELERRVVLSQFLTAIHSGGSLPPQETGLMYNSWFGKFHLEMHWWHAAHFPLWGRTQILEKSLEWYRTILPLAKQLAASQGYEGARWPKMVGPEGKQSPSTIATVLIWQQPHPMTLAEYSYRANPTKEILLRYKEIVYTSADFMASFAVWDEAREEYVLGPPLIPAQENHKPEESINPPYELEYWKFGLDIAIKWAERLQEPISSKWLNVSQALAKPPHADGVYLAHEQCPHTYTRYNHDHPSMVGALGMLPGTLIDKAIMKRTLLKVKREWDWDSAWGWDFPMCAMTAARLEERELAVEFLLLDAKKNTYLANGHNYQRPGLSAYLPGNGGLLTAVAMMTSGWHDSELDSPLFPEDGNWNVKWEGLKSIL
ncbi:glycoside hydrolase family 65 [Bacillus solitudinis]|uniref:glycoside hydrolase family 65 n=1 Tax=Bacillus solitudinis TaxID=2014074 RepID=UPI000C236B64|nr:glycoside hydrolase family 65 [Bacillus solitudinis]